jgi:hypothetical protein
MRGRISLVYGSATAATRSLEVALNGNVSTNIVLRVYLCHSAFYHATLLYILDTVTWWSASASSPVFWQRLQTAGIHLPLGSPNCSRLQLQASHCNISGMYCSRPLTRQHTNQPTIHWLLTCPAYKISARTAQKTQFLCCCLRAAA